MLILPVAFRDQLLAEARAALPKECCGLLEGIREGETVRVTTLHPAANVSLDPLSGFEIDPAVHLYLLRTLRGSGREVVGCYHSHPNGRAVPSARDRANGCEEGFIWVVIAAGAQEAVLAFHGPNFDPLPIQA